MNQPSTFHTTQQTFKKANNHKDRSKFRDHVRKFDLPPSPAPSHHSSIALKVNNNRRNGTVTSSISSSTDSIASEYTVNPSPTEQKGSLEDELILNPKHISTARLEIRPPVQPKPILHQKRAPPPTPENLKIYSKFKHDDDPIYVNSDNELEHFYDRDHTSEIERSESFPPYGKPIFNRRENLLPSSIQTNQNIQSKDRFKTPDAESIGLEIIEPVTIPQRQVTIENRYFSDSRDNIRHKSSFNTNYHPTESPERHSSSRRSPPPPPPPPPPAFAKSFLQKQQYGVQEEIEQYVPQRSLPLSNFLIELGALFVVLVLCMVLALAIREDETKLRIAKQLVYTYVYLVSIIWMIWCTIDIIKFRRQWMALTSNAQDHDEYMDITERHPHIMFYFPDIHNTGGLFMRIGAGLLCMGGLILTVIELGKAIVNIGNDELTDTYSSSVIITKIISYICRFLFHCVQFTFLFRYGNIVINRYHLLAKIGLIHLIIANFCTWFEAIVYETLEQIHEHSDYHPTTTDSTNVTYSTTTPIWINDTTTTDTVFELIKVVAAAPIPDSDTIKNKSTLEIFHEIESSMGVYLYPCLIEYSLISLTVFFIMWRNVGKSEKRSFLRFGDRHVFTINCARASRGLLIGGIIFLLTIVTLIPTYLLEDAATSVARITGFVLLLVSLFTVCLSYYRTTKLYYDRNAHVDVFDQALILITTVGDFAYSFFCLFATIFITETESKLPPGIEISIGFLAILQTFLQSGFIMDALKRRTRTKQENRNKPGRETITALLLMNLAIWMHDSFSAKKVRLNPLQIAYYNAGTWAIIQAFTSPLSIFYRFHSSVCLADIWQEIYHDNGNNDGTRVGEKNRMHRLMSISSTHESQH